MEFTFLEIQKTVKKKKTKNNLLFEQKKNIENIFLLFSKKWFLKIRKTQKNKNISYSPNKFFVFFIFKNKKQFLKTWQRLIPA